MAIYFVDATTGADGDDGLSEADAWQTIAKVNGETFSAGDRILFKRGEIWRETLTLPSSGSAGNPITFGAYGSGDKPIINGADVMSTWTSYAANTWQKTGVTTEPLQVFLDDTRLTEGTDEDSLNDHEWVWALDVLYVRDETGDPDGSGVVIEASQRTRAFDWNSKDYVTVKNFDCKYTNGSAILIDGDNFTIEDTDVSYSQGTGIVVWAAGATVTNGLIDGCAASYSLTDQGIFVGFGSDPGPGGVVVQNCTVNDNGIDTEDNGIYFSRAHDCIARYNMSRDNAGGGIIFQYGSDDNECYYNLIHGNGFDGIWVGVGDAGEDNLIYNNTIVNNAETGINIGNGASGNIIKNNLVFQDSGVVGDWKPCIQCYDATNRQAQTWDNNCGFYDGQAGRAWHDADSDTYYSLAEWQALTGSPGANSITSDPVFENEFRDLHIQVGSPCRNAGTDISLTRDYAGKSVPQETNPAIGAYEYIRTHPLGMSLGNPADGGYLAGARIVGTNK